MERNPLHPYGGAWYEEHGAHEPRLALRGGFAAYCGEAPLRIPTSGQRLVALAALSASPLDRDDAAHALWPHLPVARARANLRNALWQVRAACPAVLETEPGRLALSPRTALDARDFESLARRLADPGDDDPGLLGVDRSGLIADLLPNWGEGRLLIERERQRTLALHALEQLALRRLHAGLVADALHAAYQAVRADPLRESSVRALMRIHLETGNRVEALRAYAALRERMRSELGATVELAPETTRVLVEGLGVGGERWPGREGERP